MTKITGFFNEENVGPEARRLAHCFNLSARMNSKDGNPLTFAEDLFTASTGLAAIPRFNDDENKYLKMQLAETAAILNHGNLHSVADLEEATEVLRQHAKRMGLIR
jgi:hypothetical protein